MLPAPPTIKGETIKGRKSVRLLRLDRPHVLVGETEMMADLVNQHVADHMDEILAGFAPVIEYRAAIEEDHVGLNRRREIGRAHV